jgi:PAS domain S-box-containing protein
MAEQLQKTRGELIKEIEELKSRVARLEEEREAFPFSKAVCYDYKTLAELLPQTVFETDLAGKITFFNENSFELFGYTKDDMAKGLYAVDLIAPEDISRMVDDFSEKIKGKNSLNTEYTMLRKDGSRFPAIIYSNLVFTDNTPSGIRGILIDLSEQKTHYDRLLLMDTAIDNVSQPIFWINSEGEIIYVNLAARELLNKPSSGVIRKKIWEFHSRLSDEKWKQFWKELTVKKKIVDIFKFDNTEGKTLIFEGHSNLLKTPSMEFSFIYVADITEKIKAEEELQKVSKAIEQSSQSVIITDNKGIIEYINPNFTRVTGYLPKDVIGKKLNILKSGYSSDELFEEVWNALQNGEQWKGEFLNKRKNRQLYWESVLISPVKNKKGEITNFLTLQEDISSTKEMELELKRALDRAEESSRLKSSLLANMNHEIRTPLTGILGMAQILNEELSSPFLSQFAQNIIISGKRLMTTLNAILDLSELEADTAQINISDFYLGSQLKYSLGYYVELAEEKKLRFNFELNDENIAAHTDQKMCNQIIMNLVDNAIKYTNKGEILLRIDPVSENGASWLKVTVKDTGIGISEEDQTLIFEEFRQLSEGLNRSFEGSGLGLALVKKMVSVLGGRIEVKSILGLGSEFIVYFPAVRTFSVEEYDTPEPAITQDNGIESEMLPSILLVEDNEINTEVVLNFLNKSAIVDHVDSGEHALEVVAKKRYELILMDINLGTGIDGVKTAKRIKKTAGYEKVPIIAVTGYAMASEKRKFLEQGLDYHIAKPFSKDELIELINKVLATVAEQQNT